MKDVCKTENDKYIESLRNFIDVRAAMVLGGLLVGNKTMPIEQIKAIQKTESDLIKTSNDLNECIIGTR